MMESIKELTVWNIKFRLTSEDRSQKSNSWGDTKLYKSLLRNLLLMLSFIILSNMYIGFLFLHLVYNSFCGIYRVDLLLNIYFPWVYSSRWRYRRSTPATTITSNNQQQNYKSLRNMNFPNKKIFMFWIVPLTSQEKYNRYNWSGYFVLIQPCTNICK